VSVLYFYLKRQEDPVLQGEVSSPFTNTSGEISKKTIHAKMTLYPHTPILSDYDGGYTRRFFGDHHINGDHMNQQNITLYTQIVELHPFYYVRFHALGSHPESQVFSQMRLWVEAHGYLDDMSQHQIYGFNNPEPHKDSKEYGYELWIQVNPAELPDEDIHYFDGGRYAVTTTKLMPVTADNIIPAWSRLLTWAKEKDYEMGDHQWLEKALTPFAEEKDAYLELYLPLA